MTSGWRQKHAKFAAAQAAQKYIRWRCERIEQFAAAQAAQKNTKGGATPNA